MVVSGASSFARAHGVDRFYNPPAIRRQLEQQQLLQQKQQQQNQNNHHRHHNPVKKPSRTKPRPPPSMSPSSYTAIDESRVESDVSSSKSAVTSSSNSNSSSLPRPTPAGNLDRFLEATTPVVPAQYLPMQTSLRGWRGSDGTKLCPYFNLGDLWDSFREWSAYGAGVPLVLDGNDSVIQYYVPYLSGIQLYVDSKRPPLRSRRPGEESDGDTYQDTSSDTSGSSTSQVGEGIFGVDGEACNHLQRSIFEHLEHDSPYAREPLSDKIAALSMKFPSLRTYKSSDLHPSSWMSVAWIPTGHTLRDLDACFLTFHSLSTPSKCISNKNYIANGGSCSTTRSVINTSQMSANMTLGVFGLASYKLKGSIWTSNSHHEQQVVSSLLQAADNWLHLLQVDHPDFRFFLSRYNATWR